jgi:hypothetical protein
MILQRLREFAERVLVAHPNNYDAYLAPGIENYILSRKIAPMRFLLRLQGAQIDHAKGIDRLAKTAAHGHYLEPLARLLPADNNPNEGARLLRELHDRFQHKRYKFGGLGRIKPGA